MSIQTLAIPVNDMPALVFVNYSSELIQILDTIEAHISTELMSYWSQTCSPLQESRGGGGGGREGRCQILFFNNGLHSAENSHCLCQGSKRSHTEKWKNLPWTHSAELGSHSIHTHSWMSDNVSLNREVGNRRMWTIVGLLISLKGFLVYMPSEAWRF